MGRVISFIIIFLIFLALLKWFLNEVDSLNKKQIDKRAKPERSSRADELPILKQKINNFDEYIKQKCEHCVFYDGYDVCRNSNHWGTVIQNTVEYCNNEGNFKPDYRIIE